MLSRSPALPDLNALTFSDDFYLAFLPSSLGKTNCLALIVLAPTWDFGFAVAGRRGASVSVGSILVMSTDMSWLVGY